MNTFPKALTIAAVVSAVSVGHAVAQVGCEDPTQQAHSFFISADTRRDDLLAIEDVAVGGAGSLDAFIVQQAGSQGYRTITIDGSGVRADSIEVLSSAQSIDQGTAEFVACTEQGFLVFAVYLNARGEVAGAPSDVLVPNHAKNYANITAQSNARIGVNFNNGGADGALSIIEANVGVKGIARLVAELVLTENIASVFDFSESQAPVFGFTDSDCVVEDRVVVHKNGQQECIGLINPAVVDIQRIDGDRADSVLNENGTSTFTSVPNALYVATIGSGESQREVVFASHARETTPQTYSNDPQAPSAIDFVVGDNAISGQVDAPRNTRDIFSFEVPAGRALTGIFLTHWSAGIDQGYVFIDEGPTTVIASQDTAMAFLGGAHISATLFGPNDNLMRFLAAAVAGGVGFESPLGPGVYTFTIQQTGNVPSAYTLKFVIE